MCWSGRSYTYMCKFVSHWPHTTKWIVTMLRFGFTIAPDSGVRNPPPGPRRPRSTREAGWNGEGGAEAARRVPALRQPCSRESKMGALAGCDYLQGNRVGGSLCREARAKPTVGGRLIWGAEGGSPQVPHLAVPGAGTRCGRSDMDGSRGQEGVRGSCGVTFTGAFE